MNTLPPLEEFRKFDPNQWIQEYERNRMEIRKGVRNDFERDIHVCQIGLLSKGHPFYTRTDTETYQLIQKFVLFDSRFYPIISSLIKAFTAQQKVDLDSLNFFLHQNEFLFAVLQDHDHRDFLELNQYKDRIQNHPFRTKEDVISDTRLAQFFEILASLKIKDPHIPYTSPNRQDDGNLFLGKHKEFFCSTNEVRWGLFVGGSIGITSAKFFQAIPEEYRENWEVITSDYFHHHDTFRLMQKDSRTINQFRPFSFLHYLQMDLSSGCFSGSPFFFLDACNCIGVFDLMNTRLRAVEQLWSLLKVGGYFRTTSPHHESLFYEQCIFKKTGPSIKDFEIVYVNIVGKTYPEMTGDLESPLKAYEYGINLTKLFLLLRNKSEKEMREISSVLNNPQDIQNLMDDIWHFSPLTFAGGIEGPWARINHGIQNHAQRRSFLESLVSRIEPLLNKR